MPFNRELRDGRMLQSPGWGSVFKTGMSGVIFLLEEISQCTLARPFMRMSPFLRRLVGKNYKFSHAIVSLGLDLLVYILWLKSSSAYWKAINNTSVPNDDISSPVLE